MDGFALVKFLSAKKFSEIALKNQDFSGKKSKTASMRIKRSFNISISDNGVLHLRDGNFPRLEWKKSPKYVNSPMTNFEKDTTFQSPLAMKISEEKNFCWLKDNGCHSLLGYGLSIRSGPRTAFKDNQAAPFPLTPSIVAYWMGIVPGKECAFYVSAFLKAGLEARFAHFPSVRIR